MLTKRTLGVRSHLFLLQLVPSGLPSRKACLSGPQLPRLYNGKTPMRGSLGPFRCDN